MAKGQGGVERRAFEQAVDRFYEAAIRPELWRPVLDELCEAADAYGAILLQHSPEGASLRAASTNMGEIVEAFFAEGWSQNNPREMRARKMGMNVDSVLLDRDLFAAGELETEPWQTDFLDRYGLKWFLSLSLFGLWEAAPLVLTLERAADRPPFSEDERDMFRAALPHIRRAARMGAAVSDVWQDGVLSGLTVRGKAGFLLDAAGRVLRANEFADRLINNGLTLAGGRLGSLDPESDAALQSLIENVCQSGRTPMPPALDAIAIMRLKSGPLILQAAPLVHSTRDVLQNARALLVASPMSAPSAPAEAILTQFYRLTPAEVRVAKALAVHGGAPAAARELGVSVNTARTHLKAVFAKTGVSNQAQLAVMLSRMAGPGAAE